MTIRVTSAITFDRWSINHVSTTDLDNVTCITLCLRSPDHIGIIGENTVPFVATQCSSFTHFDSWKKILAYTSVIIVIVSLLS